MPWPASDLDRMKVRGGASSSLFANCLYLCANLIVAEGFLTQTYMTSRIVLRSVELEGKHSSVRMSLYQSLVWTLYVHALILLGGS